MASVATAGIVLWLAAPELVSMAGQALASARAHGRDHVEVAQGE